MNSNSSSNMGVSGMSSGGVKDVGNGTIRSHSTSDKSVIFNSRSIGQGAMIDPK